MSIQPYVGPNFGSENGAIVAIGAAQEITPEEYERRQKEVIVCSEFGREHQSSRMPSYMDCHRKQDNSGIHIDSNSSLVLPAEA